jgi:hypothetical protein
MTFNEKLNMKKVDEVLKQWNVRVKAHLGLVIHCDNCFTVTPDRNLFGI